MSLGCIWFDGAAKGLLQPRIDEKKSICVALLLMEVLRSYIGAREARVKLWLSKTWNIIVAFRKVHPRA
jgi:hypothetical protein